MKPWMVFALIALAAAALAAVVHLVGRPQPMVVNGPVPASLDVPLTGPYEAVMV